MPTLNRPSRPRPGVVPIALLTALLSHSTAAWAGCENFSGIAPEGFGYPDGGLWGRVGADYEPDVGDLQNVDNLDQVDGPRVPLFDVAVATETGFNSSASVDGKLGRGFAALDVLAIARASGAPAGTDALARGAAAFNDTITISAPGRNGQPGTVQLGVQVDGVLSAARSQSPGGLASRAFGRGSAAYRFGVTDGSPVPGGSSVSVTASSPARRLSSRSVMFRSGRRPSPSARSWVASSTSPTAHPLPLPS